MSGAFPDMKSTSPPCAEAAQVANEILAHRCSSLSGSLCGVGEEPVLGSGLVEQRLGLF
jgi:hypothetical protein